MAVGNRNGKHHEEAAFASETTVTFPNGELQASAQIDAEWSTLSLCWPLRGRMGRAEEESALKSSVSQEAVCTDPRWLPFPLPWFFSFRVPVCPRVGTGVNRTVFFWGLGWRGTVMDTLQFD